MKPLLYKHQFLRWLLLGSILLAPPGLLAQTATTMQVLDELATALDSAEHFDSLHRAEIDRLRGQFQAAAANDAEAQFQLADALFSAYAVFRHDSAYVYAQRMRSIAETIGSSAAVVSSQIHLGSIFVSAGMYKEALDTLAMVRLGLVPRPVRANYHGLMGRCYGDMAEFVEAEDIRTRYEQRAAFHRDSALQLAVPGSFYQQFLAGYLPATRGDLASAYRALEALFLDRQHHPRDVALITYVLGDLARQLGKSEAAIQYLARAAIADIQTSAKETLAIIRLASLLFEQGDTRRASRFIRQAYADAQFFGARQRQWQVGEILPFIEEQVITTIEAQARRLLIATVLVSLLLVFVIGLAAVTYRQMRRLRHARNVIAEAHTHQQQINEQLREANRIKEEYIGFFFHRDVQLMERLERFKSEVEQKLTNTDWQDIRSLLHQHHFRDQRDQLLREFDEAFMRLFPDYVQEFNALFPKEVKIGWAEGDSLNAELRIYALLRLGVTANEKIAQILGYSVNTIYMYKSRVRKRSLLPSEDFDAALLARITLAKEGKQA